MNFLGYTFKNFEVVREGEVRKKPVVRPTLGQFMQNMQ